MPSEPTAALVALLGRPCTRCRTRFEAEQDEAQAADHERVMLAAGQERRRREGGVRRRVTGPQPAGPAPTMNVRDATALAKRRRAERDAAHAASRQPKEWWQR